MILLKLVFRFLISHILSNELTSQFFIRGNWSYILANIVSFIFVYEFARWAFERKVADLIYKDVKVGTIKEDE